MVETRFLQPRSRRLLAFGHWKARRSWGRGWKDRSKWIKLHVNRLTTHCNRKKSLKFPSLFTVNKPVFNDHSTKNITRPRSLNSQTSRPDKSWILLLFTEFQIQREISCLDVFPAFTLTATTLENLEQLQEIRISNTRSQGPFTPALLPEVSHCRLHSVKLRACW